MLRGLLQAAAFVTAIFSITTFFNSLHRLLELFVHFRLQYFIASLLLTIIFIAMRDRRWAAGMLLLSMLNFLPLYQWYFSDSDRVVDGAATLTLLQANVLGHDNDPGQLLRLIDAQQPDIIFLQEVNETWATAMTRVEEAYPFKVVVPRYDNFGIAVYAREPLLDVEIIESPPEAFPTLLVHQNIGGTRIAFVSTHPLPPLGRAMTSARNEQLQSIAALMASLSGPKVLVGDLNITMWANHYEELATSTGLRNTRRGFGVVPTWPRHLPFAAIPIDHCLISDEFAVLEMHAGDSIGSDHLPILVRLGLR